MTRILRSLTVATALAALSGVVALAVPKPSPFPKSWELKFRCDAPKRIMVTLPDRKTPQAFWYMTFTVANETNDEQQFLPTFDLLAADGSILRSDRGVPTAVFDAIKAREKDKFLEPLTKITGRLLRGADQARDGVAIWPEPDRKMGKFSVFVAGLCGECEFYRVVNGEYEKVEKIEMDADGKPKEELILLRKTLQLNYEAAGDTDKAEPLGQEWVMR
jgi:hypothetical protein